jgi:hypothetical protein
MEDFESNLISMMVDETMDAASVCSVVFDKKRDCYQLSFHGYPLEIPSNWTSMNQTLNGDLILPKDFIEILNDELSCQFEEIKIISKSEAQYELEIKNIEYQLDPPLKAA